MPSIIRSRFADLIPDQDFSLSAIPGGRTKAAALDAAYRNGLSGCWIPGEDSSMEKVVRYAEHELRDTLGRNSFTFDRAIESQLTADTDTEYGYVASKDAYEQWESGADELADDWLFGVQQNWGDCVDAHLVEILQGLLGTRAADPENYEVFRWLATWWSYAFRGYCSHGWSIYDAANVILKHGYCLAMPEIAGIPYLTEQQGETAVARSWCRSGPPRAMQDFVDSMGWRFEPGAITKFDGGVDALKDVIRLKGQVSTGSNCTARNGIPGEIKRIGGHAQGLFGGEWSDRILEWFASKGIRRFSEDDFPCVVHQTWSLGTNQWSGETDDKYWPPWWGPKPPGAWILSARQAVSSLFRSAVVYLPQLKGTPKEGPPSPPEPKPETVHGKLYVNEWGISGDISVDTDDGDASYIFVPEGDGYVPVRKQV